MNTGWITDRLPTAEDAVAYCVLIWDDNGIGIWSCDAVKEGQPWMPIPKPAPYVKPKRWVLDWSVSEDCWILKDTKGVYTATLLNMCIEGAHGEIDKERTREAAERIADIYNETMP